MRSHFLAHRPITLAASCLVLSFTLWGAAQPDSEQVGSAGPASSSAAMPIVRGWGIRSAVALRRSQIEDSVPEFRNRQPAGTRGRVVLPHQGSFFVVQVELAWAGLGQPTESLWAGRPDVRLIDQNDVSYPFIAVLSRRSGRFLAHDMKSAGGLKPRGAPVTQSKRVLLCFDVPASEKSFVMEISKSGPHVPVVEVSALPDAASDVAE